MIEREVMWLASDTNTPISRVDAAPDENDEWWIRATFSDGRYPLTASGMKSLSERFATFEQWFPTMSDECRAAMHHYANSQSPQPA
jgi:hypothetical protein